MGKKSFYNIIYELNEATIKKDKLKIFEDIFNSRIDNEKIDFIMSNKSLFSDIYIDNGPVYYRNELYPVLNDVKEEDIPVINNIFRTYLNGEKIIMNKQNKRILMHYFKIYRSSEINNLYYFYSNCYKILDINIGTQIVNLKDLGILDGNYYFSKIFPLERRNDFARYGAYKIFELEGIRLNTFEIRVLKSYIEDIKRYQINDKLIESIITKEERKILLEYFNVKTYKNLCKILLVSETKCRTIVYTIYKKLINFFDSYEGIRALNLMFSMHPGYIKKYDIYKMFNEYSEVVIKLFSSNLIYNVSYDEKIDGFICK